MPVLATMLVQMLWELHAQCGSDQEFIEQIAAILLKKDAMITEAVRTGTDPRGVGN